MIHSAIEYVKTIFQTDYSGHDVSHTLRVYQTACRLAEAEHADLRIVQLAALLHDVDDRKLSPETHEHKNRAVSFMKSQPLSDDVIQQVCQIISEVSYAGKDSVIPSSIEGKCVQDADRLDALGAIGIARAFAYGGSRGRVMYDPEIKPNLDMSGEAYHRHISTTVNHFYEKLFLLQDMMNTETARAIAEHRTQYMHSYLDEFLSEWEGIL